MRLFIICKPYMNPVFNCKVLFFAGIRSLVLRETAETETKKGGDSMSVSINETMTKNTENIRVS